MSRSSFNDPNTSSEKLFPGHPPLEGALQDENIKNKTNKQV